MLYAVIMAGGAGTRFWPQSTEAKPKQFLALFGQKTMLQTTVQRIEPLIPSDRILIVTNKRYADLVAEQLPDIPRQNIIGEPVGKNTAPCVGAAAAFIAQKDENATMAVLPADHLIKNEKAFISTLKQADEKARHSEALVTLGIQPHRPETGFGYIEFEKDDEANSGEAQKVVQFREKPDEVTAEKFLKAGNFLWNSGMFIWQVSTIISEFKKHLPDVYEQIKKLQSEQITLGNFYHTCSSVSIDYGIMEKAKKVWVIPADFDWNDVGDWKAFYELSKKDKNGNAIHAETWIVENAENNLVQSQSGKVIALSGVDNIAFIETDKAILVCDIDEAQSIKQAVNQIRDNKELKRFL